MANAKYSEKITFLKTERFVGQTQYGTAGADGLSSPGVTTSVGAEGRAVLAAGGALQDDRHSAVDQPFAPASDTVDLSSLSAPGHAPAAGHEAAASFAVTSAAPAAAAWSPVDDVAFALAAHHPDGAAGHDLFSAHFAHPTPYDFG